MGYLRSQRSGDPNIPDGCGEPSWFEATHHLDAMSVQPRLSAARRERTFGSTWRCYSIQMT